VENIVGGITQSAVDADVCELGLGAIFSNAFCILLTDPVSAVCATAVLE